MKNLKLNNSLTIMLVIVSCLNVKFNTTIMAAEEPAKDKLFQSEKEIIDKEKNKKILKKNKKQIIENSNNYIQKQKEATISAEEDRYSNRGVCAFGTYKKTYMDYRAININSTQRHIIDNQTSVRDDGLLVTEDGFIGVALGSTYGALGTRYRITTDTGQVFKVIKVEAKSDNHTTNGCQDGSGAIVEFVIDQDKARESYSSAMYHGDFNHIAEFNGSIVKIESYI